MQYYLVKLYGTYQRRISLGRSLESDKRGKGSNFHVGITPVGGVAVARGVGKVVGGKAVTVLTGGRRKGMDVEGSE